MFIKIQKNCCDWPCHIWLQFIINRSYKFEMCILRHQRNNEFRKYDVAIIDSRNCRQSAVCCRCVWQQSQTTWGAPGDYVERCSVFSMSGKLQPWEDKCRWLHLFLWLRIWFNHSPLILVRYPWLCSQLVQVSLSRSFRVKCQNVISRPFILPLVGFPLTLLLALYSSCTLPLLLLPISVLFLLLCNMDSKKVAAWKTFWHPYCTTKVTM